MQFKSAFAGMALAGTLVIASLTGAAAQDHGQPPSPPQQTPQAAGAFGATWLGAVVAANGTHVAGTGGLGLASTATLGTGSYEVAFRRNIDRCVATGSIGNRGFGSAHGFIDIVPRSGNPKAYFVQTKDVFGVAADLNFIMLVYCTD